MKHFRLYTLFLGLALSSLIWLAGCEKEALFEEPTDAPSLQADPVIPCPQPDISRNINGTIVAKFDPFILAYTDQFNLAWDDQGSRGLHKGSFFNPIPPTGFYFLGSVGVNSYPSGRSLDGLEAALCIKADANHSDLLRLPTSYELIWTDKGSGAHLSGSCWRPVPPQGFVALGALFVRGHAQPRPQDYNLVCVKREYTENGVLSKDPIWTDARTGAKKDFSAWQINPPKGYLDEEYMTIAPNSFAGVGSHERPVDPPSPVTNVLKVKIPLVLGCNAQDPQIGTCDNPNRFTPSVLNKSIVIPFTAIKDSARTLTWQVHNSPFYVLEKWEFYNSSQVDRNHSADRETKAHAVTKGITESSSQTMSLEIGVSISEEAGISIDGVGEKTSATFSTKFGYSTQTGVQILSSVTETITYDIEPFSCGVLYFSTTEWKVRRNDPNDQYIQTHVQIFNTGETTVAVTQSENQAPL